MIGRGEHAGGVGVVVVQVGDQAEQLGGVPPGHGDGVLDHPDGQRDPAAGDLRQVGAVGQEVPGPAQRDAVPDPDQHVGAGGQHGLDAGHAGIVAVHDPQPPRGEQVPVVLQRLVQQHLLGLALVPAAAGAAPDGPVATPKVARVEAATAAAPAAAGTGRSHRRCPPTRTPARFAGVSGTRISDPSIEPTSRSPTVTAR